MGSVKREHVKCVGAESAGGDAGEGGVTEDSPRVDPADPGAG